MTERSPGAPDPVGPSNSGGTREPGGRRPAPVVGLLTDLGAVRRTDAIIDALAARRAAVSAPRSATDLPTALPGRPAPALAQPRAAADCSTPAPPGDRAIAADRFAAGEPATSADRSAEAGGAIAGDCSTVGERAAAGDRFANAGGATVGDCSSATECGTVADRARAGDGDEGAADPVVRLLRALIADVDDQEPGRPVTAPPSDPGPGAPPSTPGPGPRRRGPRTIVALGVAGAVLASTGVAAAGGRVAERTTASPPAGASGHAGPRAEDTDAGTLAPPPRPAPATPVRLTSVPESAGDGPDTGLPATEDAGHKDYDRIKRRLEHMLRDGDRPHHRTPRRTDAPRSTPFVRPSSPPGDDTRRTIEDIRKRTQNRLRHYEAPPRD